MSPQPPASGAPVAPAPDPATDARLKQALEAAVALQKSGTLDRAAAAYHGILETWPNQPDALNLLGVVAHQRRDHAAAAELIRRAIAIKADKASYHNNLGTALLHGGKAEEAAASFRRAVELDPDFLQALCNLGRACQAQGQTDNAIAAFRRAAELQPQSAEIACLLGAALLKQGSSDQALAQLEQAVALDPRSAEAQYQLGMAFKDRGDRGKAIACYRRTIEANPRHPGAHNNLGLALDEAGRFETAEAAYRKALEIFPKSAELSCNLGATLRNQRRFEEAESCFRQAIALKPDFAGAHDDLGALLQILGRFDDARAAFEQALALDPGLVRSHANLASLSKAEPGDPIVDRLRDQLERRDLAPEPRSELQLALGKCLDDLGDHDAAFAQVHAGNELRGGAGAFDAAAWSRDIDHLIATFDADFFAERRELGDPSERPLFVLGLPRSGTSLTEQILCRHPAIAGAGELNDLSLMTRDLPALLKTEDPYPDCLSRIDAGTVGHLAGAYLARLDTVSAEALRVVDKMPNNFLRVGLIALLFPKARVIHCRRDPVDVCLSCYMQHFKGSHTYSYDFANMGRYHRDYERLMAHWREVLPLQIFELSYEALVADPEPATREMIAFSGLAWDDGCLSHQGAKQPVATASAWQARQPIYESSVERWRRYEKHLTPLFEALGGG